MTLRGDTQGVFRLQATPRVEIAGYILITDLVPNGIEAIQIIASPIVIEAGKRVPTEFADFQAYIYEFAAGAFDEFTNSAVDATGTTWRMTVTTIDTSESDASYAAVPLFSQTFIHAPTDGWRAVAPGYAFKRDGTELSFFTTFLTYQFQAVHEAAWWPNNNVDAVVHSAWGMPMGRMNTAGLCDALHSDGGTKGQCTYYIARFPFYNEGMPGWVMSYFTSYTPLGGPLGFLDYTSDAAGTTAIPQYDRLFDIPPAYYTADGTVLGGIGPYRDDYTWYRHGAIVKSDRGNSFFVVADNKGGFMFYRALAYWADLDVLAACVDQPGFPGVKAPASTAIGYVRVVPTYPAWATLPTDGVNTPLQWWNWQFNKDASKAVTVAMNSTNRANWFHHVDADDATIQSNPAWWEKWFIDPVAQAANASGVGGISGGIKDSILYFDQAKKGSPCRKDLPGLVEVAISIVEFGNGPTDFVPSVNVIQEDFFGDSGRYWVDAAYAFPGLSVPEDSLITAEIECYRNTSRWFHKYNPATGIFSDGAVDGSDYNQYAWIDIPDFGAAWVVKSNGTELAREVLQHNAQILAFLPILTPNDATSTSNAPWVINNAGRYWRSAGQYLNRLSSVAGRKISMAKGMFTCGSTVLRQPYFGVTPSAPYERYSAEMVTVDLRSVSYVVRQEYFLYTGTTSGLFITNVKHTVQHKVVAFEDEQEITAPAGRTKNINRMQTTTGYADSSNEDVRNVTPVTVGDVNTVTYIPFDMPDPPATPIAMDKVLHEQLFTTVSLSRLPNFTHHEIRTTPKGDWSIWVIDADTGVVDMIHTVASNDSKNTTHLDLVNEAFKKTLIASYYGELSGTTGYRNLGGFGLARNWLPRFSP